jgi:alkylation response protein AidB-like acyl-CoA dehydrogenase
MTATIQSVHAETDASQLIANARELAPRVREYSDEIERGRRLPEPVVEMLRQEGFFHALLPRDIGGIEADPVTAARIVEEIARGDASAGWCVMIAAQCCSFAGFMAREESKAIWSDGGIVAGTARPIGKAVATADPDDGFIVSGRWPFASGSTHASWFSGECIVYDGDEPRRDANGEEVSRMCFVPRRDVTVHDNWDTMGLSGTASNDFSIEGAFVPRSRGFQVMVDPPVHDWPLYKALPLLFINHGSHALGVARGAIDSAIEIAGSKRGWGGVIMKEVPRLQGTIAEATALVDSAAIYLYDTSWRLWQSVLNGEDDARLRGKVRLATSHAAKSSVQAVDLLHGALATSAIFNSSPLARQFRDMHVAAAHVMIGSMTFEASGRVIMGMEAGFPFF